MVTVRQELEIARNAGVRVGKIAEEAGVSAGTMCRIANGDDVSESTALAVRTAIRRIVERLGGELKNG